MFQGNIPRGNPLIIIIWRFIDFYDSIAFAKFKTIFILSYKLIDITAIHGVGILQQYPMTVHE